MPESEEQQIAELVLATAQAGLAVAANKKADEEKKQKQKCQKSS